MSLEDSIRKLSPKLPVFDAGHVWLAGAGPGNPGALTLDVVSALGQADAIVYDALIDASVLNSAEGADLHFMGKRGGRESAAQEDICNLLIKLAQAGKRVLRLKGGDPYIFGRGGEEALAMVRAGVPYRILPGVTSAFGAMASVGIPATMRGINKAIILATGHAAGTPDDLDWEALARTGQPIVVYMGVKNAAVIAARLISGGIRPETPVAVIISATTPQERVIVTSIEEMAARPDYLDFASPALIVIGDVVSMRRELVSA